MTRPGFYHTSNDWSNRNERKSVWVDFDSYRELLRKLPEYIKTSLNEEIHVFRSRRGEWGEWFEVWQLDSKGKKRLIKEGWN